MLSVQNIHIRFGIDDILSDVSLSITGSRQKKIAIVGRNGSGKSTLVGVLAGQLEPDLGLVTWENEIVGYLEQESDFSMYEFVGEFLEGKISESWEEYKIETALRDVGLGTDYIYKPTVGLSGGEKVKIALAGILISEPTILLLDEPTNNLDVDGIEWLIKFLKAFKGSVVFISHDRYLINAIADNIWEIDSTTRNINVYGGNYDEYVDEKERIMNNLLADYHARNREIKRLRMWLRENEFHPKYRFSAFVTSQKKKLAKLESAQIDKPPVEVVTNIQKLGEQHRGRVLKVSIEEKSFDKHVVLKNLEFDIHKGERMLLSGPNGSGKSTLLRIISGEDVEFDGSIEVGEEIRIGYLRQKSDLDPNSTVLREFEKQTGIIEPQSRSVLAKYGFDVKMVLQKVSLLSFGQLKRLDLAIILAGQPNLLILDEPTNHLDTPTREEIESFITEQSIAMIIISHDKYFVDKLKIDEIVALG